MDKKTIKEHDAMAAEWMETTPPTKIFKQPKNVHRCHEMSFGLDDLVNYNGQIHELVRVIRENAYYQIKKEGLLDDLKKIGERFSYDGYYGQIRYQCWFETHEKEWNHFTEVL